MSKNVLAFAIFVLLAVMLATACEAEPTTIQASGNYVTETRDVRGFNAVTISGNAHVNIVRDGTESLAITIDDNVLPHMQIQVSNGRLYLQPRPNLRIDNDHGYTVTLTIKDLASLQLAGNSNAQVSGIDAPQLQAELNGNSYAALSGTAGRQDITVDGNSFYDAEKLPSEQAIVRANGNSHVTVRVSNTLDVVAQDLSTVEYFGSPLVRERVDNLASLKQRAPH